MGLFICTQDRKLCGLADVATVSVSHESSSASSSISPSTSAIPPILLHDQLPPSFAGSSLTYLSLSSSSVSAPSSTSASSASASSLRMPARTVVADYTTNHLSTGHLHLTSTDVTPPRQV